MTKTISKKPTLSSLPEFIGLLPRTLKIPNKKTIIIIDQLQNSNISIPANSNTTFIALLKKGWQDIQKINFNFEGKNSTLTFLAFIIGKNEEKFHFETISNHKIPQTGAYYYIRSVLFDKSEVDYTGNLTIKPKAQLTDSYLAHHILMLSKNAKVHTIPSLEIEADDVKAGHAASIGHIDEDLIFYLKSRGLDKETSEELLIKGFMQNDLAKIPNEEIRQIIAEEIENSL